MVSKKFKVTHVGPIADASVEFGDLTVLVGPQATGKSIFLQLFKLALDPGYITNRLRSAGFDWEGELGKFFNIYLGEGMERAWNKAKSRMLLDGKRVDAKNIFSKSNKPLESLYFVPAQRVLTLQNGWPRMFFEFSTYDPFVVRSFSESIMRFMLSFEIRNVEKLDNLFPNDRRMESAGRESLNRAIFNGAELMLDREGPQRRLMLRIGDEKLPFMVWSAGQREFVPLLLGVYQLFPSYKTRKIKGVEWVVIEEPEMGLHPRAIFSVMLLVLEMLYRGYKVILSTHSNQVLDVVWGIQEIKRQGASAGYIAKLFGQSPDASLTRMAKNILEKNYKVYSFDRKDAGVYSQDISNLDPGSDDIQEAGWGGLSEFSGHVADVVSDVTRNSQSN